MSSAVSVRIVGEPEYDRWADLLSKSDQASAYASPIYLDVLCSALGGQFHLAGAFRGSELIGGIALYEQPAWPGLIVRPRPLIWYNGVILKTHDSKYPSQRTARSMTVMAALEAAISGMGYGRVVLKNHHTVTDVRVFQDRGWRAYPTYTYVVPLDDLAGQWTLVEQNLRRLITRCRSQGFTFTDDDDFDGFYDQHAETAGRKQAPLYLPRKTFRAFFERLRSLGYCRLFQARLPDGQAAATQMVLLGPYATAHTACAAADARFLNSGASAFLRWNAFEWLGRAGYGETDLTDAAIGSVTHFKSQFGGNLASCLVLQGSESLSFRLKSSGHSFAQRSRRLARRCTFFPRNDRTPRVSPRQG